MLRYLPNFLTCCNLACGCLGLVFIFEFNLFAASICIFVGMIFDFLDGLAARLLKAYSEIGQQLDSLADMVTFGILPSFIVYSIFIKSFSINGDIANTLFYFKYTPYLAFLIAIFSALRLAKFNIDTRQKDIFVGLPTPASALVIASLPMILVQNQAWQRIIQNPLFLSGLVIILCFLMVVEIPLFSLKFKDFTWQKNQIRYIFLILSLLLLGFLKILALPIIIFLYVLMSLVFWKRG